MGKFIEISQGSVSDMENFMAMTSFNLTANWVIVNTHRHFKKKQQDLKKNVNIKVY